MEVESLQSFLTSLEEEKDTEKQDWEQQIDDLEKKIEHLQQENEEKNEKILMYESETERTIKQCEQAFVSDLYY